MTEVTAELGLLAPDGGTRWSIDRRVPLALIVAGLAQFGVLCAGGATLIATLNAHGDRLTRLEAANTASGETLRLMEIDLARMTERLTILTDRPAPPPR